MEQLAEIEQSLAFNWWHLGIGLGALVVLAIIADWMKSRIIAKTLGMVASGTQISLDQSPFDKTVLRRLAPIVPALVVYYGIVPALGVTRSDVEAGTEAQLLIVFWTLVRRLSAAYIAFVIARTLVAVLDSFSAIYHRSSPASIAKPIKSYMQVAKLAIYLIAGIVIVALLLGRSPVVFLSGIGALAAILMLVFRNTLVSLAASVQITSNDIVRIGDWVEVPHAHANGSVIDIDLHMIRVRNWDKTISTIPTHRFIADSFKNWRGMFESGGRRIKRAILINVNTVRFLTPEEIFRLSRSEPLKGHLRHRLDEMLRPGIQDTRSTHAAEGESAAQAKQITNLEMFRHYVEGYLRAHPNTHKEMTLMVRQLAPGPHGAPIEVYCFSNDTKWLNYEAFQSEVFDHLYATLPAFGLRAFQEWSGSDLPQRREPLASDTICGPIPGS